MKFVVIEDDMRQPDNMTKCYFCIIICDNFIIHIT